jgi:hypothetical protein
MNTPTDTVAEQVRGAAFRRLLQTSTPATAGQIADDLDLPEHHIQVAIADLNGQGWLRLDTHGHVVGSAGLSVHPDRHQIELDGTKFWTWCAYDILGIFAALRATGTAHSTTPDGGPPLQIRFRDGRPEPTTLVLFLPDDDSAACCTSMYDQWCPNSNLFHTAEAASFWAAAHHVTGTALTLSDAAELGEQRWRPLTQNQPT